MIKGIAILFTVAAASWGQTTPAPAPGSSQNAAAAAPANAGQTGGFEAEWDVKKSMEALAAGTRKLKPIVDQSNPQQWNKAGGANDYFPQWKNAENQMQYLITSSEALSKQPERLPLALETYFRLEALDTTLNSLIEGIRKHHNPGVADLLRSSMTDNANNRERLKQYITELATTKEQEFQVMDKEAQRCRAEMNRLPAPVTRTKK